MGVWAASSWLRIGRGGGHLGMRQLIFGLHKMRGISIQAVNRLTSQVGLRSME
jgi:hypothetical protein